MSQSNFYNLSICIPTYNRSSHLANVIEKFIPIIKNKNIEIVISDNNSSDNTTDVLAPFLDKYSFIKYYKNDFNIGLDLNFLNAIEKSNSNYCWLFSDDDIPLESSINNILENIKFHPVLVYFNYSGFLDGNENTAVVEKKENFISDNPELFLKKYLINHFSATVIRKPDFLKNKDVIKDYANLGFERGYILTVAHYTILKSKSSVIFIGETSLLTRNNENLISNGYNPLTIVYEIALHYQIMRKKGLIKRETESHVLNYYLRGFYNIIIPIKLNYYDFYQKELVFRFIKHCKYYKNFYFFNLPFILTPRIILKFSYNLYKKLGF
jgi:glycosyltransferase involved in cell wall biosynthesis